MSRYRVVSTRENVFYIERRGNWWDLWGWKPVGFQPTPYGPPAAGIFYSTSEAKKAIADQIDRDDWHEEQKRGERAWKRDHPPEKWP